MTLTLSSEKIIEQTQCWISSVIVAFNFCPFAKREIERNSVFYRVCSDTTMEAVLEHFIDECVRLDKNPDIETSFLIFSKQFTNFISFLGLIELATELLVTQHYEGVYQIASFHPEYRFANSSLDDASNYTNRSPYPMLHLLREESLERALEGYSDSDQIPIQNIEKSRQLGNDVFKKLLMKCKK